LSKRLKDYFLFMDILFDNRTLSELCGQRMTQEAWCWSCVVT